MYFTFTSFNMIFLNDTLNFVTSNLKIWKGFWEAFVGDGREKGVQCYKECVRVYVLKVNNERGR